MHSDQKVQLDRLREIGWDSWDPIGIRAVGSDDWLKNAADEYDDYLLHVASMLSKGGSEQSAVEYLNWVASEHMSLGPITKDANEASQRTVRSIAEYVATLA